MSTLEKIIIQQNLKAKLLNFESSTHTAEDVVRLLNCRQSQIIKSLIVIAKYSDGSVTPFLVLVPGNKKLKQTLLRKALKKKGILLKDSRLASPQEVKEYTGYEVGGVPPLILDFKTILEEELLKETIIYGGGGTSTTLLQISIQELIHLTRPITGTICKEII